MVPAGSLPQALATAEPGQTLLLGAGIHAGPLTLDRPVRLIAQPGAVIEGPGHGTVVLLEADGITLEGLEIRGSGGDLSHDDAVVRLKQSHDIRIADCRIKARAFGIYIEAGGGHRLERNQVVGDATLALASRGNGIHLWHTRDNTVRDNTLADVRDGVYLSFAHDNRIVGNRGRGLRYGIHYMYSERNLLRENHFSNGTGGIAMMFSMRNRVEANHTVNNRDFGILCQQLESSTVVGNHAERNGRGLFIEGSVGNRFADNRIRANGVGAFLTAASEANIFTGNIFDGNLVQVYQDRSAGNAWWQDGRGNAWSDYAGFDWNGDGVGESPYRLETAASALLARRPAARWFLLSPVLAVLDWWDAQMPSPAGPEAFDRFPLVVAAGRLP